MTRIAVYARFSSDELQDERSIPDQQRLCQERASRIEPGAGPIRHFTDAGISGASMINRLGLQALLRAAANGEIDLVRRIAGSPQSQSGGHRPHLSAAHVCRHSAGHRRGRRDRRDGHRLQGHDERAVPEGTGV